MSAPREISAAEREALVAKIQVGLARVYCLQRQDGFHALGQPIAAVDVDRLHEQLKAHPMFREMAEVAMRLVFGDEDGLEPGEIG
jgi:hypothetical protein